MRQKLFRLLIFLQLSVDFASLGLFLDCIGAEYPVVIRTNTVIRIMSANLTGSSQKYEAPAIRIFQGLKPDIVAIQEFNYSNNTSNDIRYFVNMAFGTNYYYYRETNPGYSIPNGVVSKYPIIESGSWDDPEIPDRGFAWAIIDIPGETNLMVVSVHFKASASDAARRAIEAITLKSLVLTNSKSNYYVVAGDLNTSSSSEQALVILKSFLVDEPIPTDTNGDPDTNLNRNERYDYILCSPPFASLMSATILGTQQFTNGLVFDSRNYPYLSELLPIQKNDSGYAQHMAVLKDFKITYTLTNIVYIESPKLFISGDLEIFSMDTTVYGWTLWCSLDLVNWNKITNLPQSIHSFSVRDYTSNQWMFFRLSSP